MTDLNVTAQLEVDDGTGTSRQFSVNDLKTAQTGAAADATLTTGVGAAGTSPPALATSASGIIGWLRKIVDTLTGTLTVSGPVTDTQLRATPLPVTGTVTATVDETTLAKDATLTTLVGGPGSGVATITGSGSGIQGLLRMIWDTLRGSIAVTGTFWQATQPVSIASTVAVDRPTATATSSNVASSATTGTLLAANASRKAFTIFNDSTAVLYVKFGTTASATSYTVQIAAGGYYEAAGWNYTGRIDGLWASANGNARVTEMT